MKNYWILLFIVSGLLFFTYWNLLFKKKLITQPFWIKAKKTIIYILLFFCLIVSVNKINEIELVNDLYIIQFVGEWMMRVTFIEFISIVLFYNFYGDNWNIKAFKRVDQFFEAGIYLLMIGFWLQRLY